MRFRTWLSPKLASLGNALKAYRVNPRAVWFGVACWLLWSGVQEFSPAAARITLGVVFLAAIFWPEAKKGRP